MLLSALLKFAEGELEQAGIEEYVLEARLLLQACLKKSRTEIFLSALEVVASADQTRYLGFISRRKKREPVAYILGEQDFWSMPFFVSPSVLIPRPETEFLLDRVLALVTPENLQKGALLDLCCGSGVIASVLATETGKRIIASDISSLALEICRSNLYRHGLVAQVALVEADLFSAFRMRQDFSLIVSNPPYVRRFDLENNIEAEVAKHEPRLALDGGGAGMDFIIRIRQEVPKLICPGGQLFLEIGADQGEAVRLLFTEGQKGRSDFQQVDILVDYAGRDRVLHAKMVL
ncbi:MAG: peptide chain release factor N(5)-glutamine methyltransferase [Proteobacteria bacterium]|nr:peptide chain release factor N(5)-glutamine methyltransferase [Pseudomonadota bacterium]